jgi:hypothetical protein
MSIVPTSPITGATQTGFTSPTYTIVADSNPAANGKQWIVSALGGTQAGVTAHSANDVFTVSVFKPLVYKVLNFVSSAVLRKPPRNTYKVVTRKGVAFLTGQPKDIQQMTSFVDVPSGSESLDAPNIRAALSLHIGFLYQVSSGFGDTIITNTL